MVFLVGLSKFVKRIRANRFYRWLSFLVCVGVFFMICVYIHGIIAHTIIQIPIWLWGIIPAIAIFIFLLTGGIKEKTILLSIVLGGCLGIVITGILSLLFYTTNYWLAGSQTYQLDAYVMGKIHHKSMGGRHYFKLAVYNVNLKFLKTKELFALDDPEAYKKFNHGDTVKVTMVNGLYGIPIIKDLSSK